MLDTIVLNLSTMLTKTVCSHILYLAAFIIYIEFRIRDNIKVAGEYRALEFGSIIGSLTTALIYNPDAFTIYWTLICTTLIILCISDKK